MSLPVRVAIAGLDLVGHHVRRLHLKEDLHRPWVVRLEMADVDADLDLERAIGAAVRIELPDEPFVPSIVGHLRDVQQTDVERTGESTYLLHVAPASSLLGLRRAQRIFQHLTVVDLVRSLLGEHAIGAPEARLLEEHPVHEYRVQWNETDLELVQRLLADEGIVLVHDPREDRLRLVDDSRTLTEPLDRILEVRADADALRDPEEPPCVRGVSLGRALTTGRVAVRDFDFEHPEFVPEAQGSSGVGREAGLDAYEFQVGEFHDEAGAGLAGLRRLEAMRSEARTLELVTTAIVSAGRRVGVVGGARSGIDGEHLVVSAETSWSAKARTTLLRCIPSAVRFRPPRPPKPRVHGTQTAFVVVPVGEEIDVDEHGRIEVEFRWDRRDTHAAGASRRVRVSQPWAGAGYGMTLIPRKDDEVVVAYLDGDPDEPIVVGRVHNGAHIDPLALPAQKTESIWKSRSVPGGPEAYNMVRMEDAAGAEMLELRGQRDFRSEALRNSETIVGVDEKKKVGGSSQTEVAGAYSLKSASTSIGTGPYSLDATSITLNSSSFIKENSGSNHLIDTGGFWVSASSVAQISAPKIVLMAGGSSITITPGEITIKSAGPVKINGAPILLNC